MSLTKRGQAPGPVRFYLVCDRSGCDERVSFDLVIDRPPPDRETDFFGYLLHEASEAAPVIADMDWTFVRDSDGYWCHHCSTPNGPHRSGPTDT